VPPGEEGRTGWLSSKAEICSADHWTNHPGVYCPLWFGCDPPARVGRCREIVQKYDGLATVAD